MSKSSKRVEPIKAIDSAMRFPAPDASVGYSLDEILAYQLRMTYKYFILNLQPLLDAYEVPLGM